MWKNNKNGNALKGLYYSTYEIKGLNLDRLIDVYKKRGILLYNLKKRGNNRLLVTVTAKDDEKIFAISKELCYNIKKLSNSGKAYPFLFLFRNFGLFLGAIIFTTFAFLSNDVILKVEYRGASSYYYRQAQDVLDEQGIGLFTKFSSFNTKVLAGKILGGSPNLSYASCQKRGNRLIIELAVKDEDAKVLKGNASALYCNYDGVVENIKVYRGQATVSQGESVKSGDLLVDGNVLIGENKVFVGVIASVSIKTTSVYKYTSQKDNMESEALAFALENSQSFALIDSAVQKEQLENGYLYTVTLICRKVIYSE